MGFSRSLRSNSEHYLLIDAQRRMAARYGVPAPAAPRGLRERFWRQVFAPAYRVLPFRLRQFVIRSLPGSHRRDWPVPSEQPREPAV